MLERFTMSGLTWPPDPALTDAELERRLYRGQSSRGTAKPCVRPNYAEVSQQLSRKGVTRRLLWGEYRDQHDDGIGYSVFCDELAAYLGDRDLSYRNDHVPGEKGYFDFAGMTLRYRDGDSEQAAQIFVAALGYSNATFAHAFADQTAVSWLDGQHCAFVVFGGVPKVGVPDNPKALIAKADRHEPRLTQGYADFARHYGITIIPARVRKPKDKAAVEGAVKIVEMRILATARDRVFASLDALNAWLHEALIALNASPLPEARRFTCQPVGRGAKTLVAVAIVALRVAGVPDAQARLRLPRRCASPVLQRTVPARRADGRGAAHARACRGAARGHARRTACARTGKPALRHRSRAHAGASPRLP
jgi:transposase